MVDPYVPRLVSFQYSEEEQSLIDLAMLDLKPWDWTPGSHNEQTFKGLKNKIRDFHLQRQGQKCCYCRTRINGAFMIDREHILPKSKSNYKDYTFSIWNLSVACKNCNMVIKRTDDSFVTEKTNETLLRDGANYLIIHPNFDKWDDHLSRSDVSLPGLDIVKITNHSKSAKANFTCEYFHIKELEISHLDEAQGQKPRSQMISEAINELEGLIRETFE